MALQHINVSTYTTISQLFTVKSGLKGPIAIQIYNGHSASIFIGDNTVAASGANLGRTIPTLGSFQIWLNSGDIVYGISTAASATGVIVITYSA